MSAAPSLPNTVTGGPAPGAGPKPGLILATVVSCQLMLVLDGTIVNIALPKMQKGLHFSDANLSWVLNAYTLAFGGLLLLGGRAGDILGRRRMFVAGVVVFTVASFAGGLAVDSGMLLASRLCQGVGAAMAGPSMLALIVTTFPEGVPRVKAMSLFTAVSSAGGSIGLLLGGVLTSWGSWRLVMFINVPVGIAAAVAASRLLPESPRQAGRFDVVGALTSVGGMTSLVYGCVNAAGSGWGDTRTIAALAIAVVLLGAFVAAESRVEQPVVPLRLLRDPVRARGYFGYVLLIGAMFATFFFTSQFMQKVLHYSPLKTGFAFLPLSVMLFAVSRLVPKLMPRLGARRLVIIGTVLITVGLFWLSRISPDTHFATGLLFPLMLFGFGGGMAFSPLAIMLMSGLSPRDTGSASGLLQACQQVGGSLGLAVLVTVFSAAAKHGHSTVEANTSQGLRMALLVAAVFAFCVVLVATTLKPRAAPGKPG